MNYNPNQHLRYLGFESALPSISLKPYVMGYWMIKRQTQLDKIHSEYLHPDGGLGLIFNLGDPFQFDGAVLKESSYMDGTHTTSTLLGLHGKIHAVGIRFLPGGGYPFLTNSLNSIKNHTVNIKDLKLKNLAVMYQQLHNVCSMNDVTIVLEKWLTKNYCDQFQTSAVIPAVVKSIQNFKGQININNMVSHLNISQRQLERLFKTQVGMTPKKLARIIRIDDARKQLKQRKQSGIEMLAHLNGFYDQAHFIKEFKLIIGKTPGAYLSRKERADYSKF